MYLENNEYLDGVIDGVIDEGNGCDNRVEPALDSNDKVWATPIRSYEDIVRIDEFVPLIPRHLKDQVLEYIDQCVRGRGEPPTLHMVYFDVVVDSLLSEKAKQRSRGGKRRSRLTWFANGRSLF